MTKTSYTPRWLDLRDEVAKSIGLLNSPVNDRKTINVLDNVTRTLMNKQALPDGLKATFIDNIRHRTRHTDFAYDGKIRLTANQIKYARQHGRDQIIPLPAPQAISSTFHPDCDKDELLAAFQRHFIHIASGFQPDFTQLSSILGLRAAQLLEVWWRNEIKSNEINHENAMTCPSDDLGLASSPDVHEAANDRHELAALSGVAMMHHEPAAAGFPQARAIIEDHGGGEGIAMEVPAPVVQISPRKTRRPEIAISYFHNDPTKAPSAMFEIGADKYSLLFATAEIAEERLQAASTSQWRSWFEQQGGDDIRRNSRAASSTGRVAQYVMSPLYAANDKYGYKPPVEQNCVVVLGWEGDMLVSALLVAGESFFPIALERFSHGEGKKPLFKGRTALPEPKEAPAMAA